MNSPSVKVVIAHYHEDLEWIKLVKYPCEVISRYRINLETPPNRGYEASSYLEYIIENYDSLDDYTIFVHGHRSSWHHKSNVDDKINVLVFIGNYFNFNEKQLEKLDQLYPPDNLPDPIHREAFMDFIQFTGFDIDFTNIYFRCSAQFYVSRDAIRRHPKEVYMKMHDWLMTTKHISFWSSRVFEHSWHYIFTGSLIDVLHI